MTTTSTLSRRMLVASAAALPALTVPALASADNPDAKLLALGGRLKAAIAKTAAAKPDQRLYDEAWKASGFDKKPAGVRSTACEDKFRKVADANGYSTARDKWDDADEAEQKIAEVILAMPSHSRIGDGVRAAATLSREKDMYCRDAELLWEMAARAGFVVPAEMAEGLESGGSAVTADDHDPIFGPIKKYDGLFAEHCANCSAEPPLKSTDHQSWETATAAVADRMAEAYEEMIATTPTTPAGAIALIHRVVEGEKRGGSIGGSDSIVAMLETITAFLERH